MPDYGEHYAVNETYRSSKTDSKDQFPTWLNGPIETGISNTRGIRSIANPQTEAREFLVFYSTAGRSRTQHPWEDVINMEEGTVRYWGDATAGNGPDPADAQEGFRGWFGKDLRARRDAKLRSQLF